jgi:hypothetical protein
LKGEILRECKIDHSGQAITGFLLSVKKSAVRPVNIAKPGSAAGDLQSTRVANSVKPNIFQRLFSAQFSLHSMESVG